MKRIPFFIVDAFTDTAFQGNPAGVFLDDEGVLTPEACGTLCDEVHLESAFITPVGSADADFRLRYFTGTTRKVSSSDPLDLSVSPIEVPFCGHDTVAAALVLVHTGRARAGTTIRFVNNVGVVPVEVADDGGGGVTATLIQTPQERGTPLTPSYTEEVAAALGCAPKDIMATGLPVQVYSTGTPWLYVPVRDRSSVDGSPADYDAITALSRRYGTFGIYVFAVEGASVWSRCFAPIAGLNEDPVTGSASGGLGWYLTENNLLTPGATLTAQQGFGGGRGGTARIRVEGSAGGGGRPERITVTGAATLVAEGTFLRG
jgi:PhzF family phenazine biosynthesis protein